MNSGDRGRREQLPPASALALQLWLASMLCWWVIGITLSRLWWLANTDQQHWILFCYAWEVPAVGWTGAVLLPYLAFQRLQRRLEAGDPGIARDLARYPLRVALLVIGTSSVGYLLGAIQIDHFTRLPTLEFIKITVQGPALGALFAVAAYLMAERQIERLGMPLPPGRPTSSNVGSGPSGAPEPGAVPASPAKRPLTLIIDDERSVRMALRRYFERCGWDVEEAEDGSQAMGRLERPEASAYGLVITDLRMPGRTGLEVHDWMAEHRPELFGRLIIATGDVASPEIHAFIRRTPRPVLEKPFELSTLAALVERVVGEGDRAIGR
jgi:CheY-like chemotaxis protein